MSASEDGVAPAAGAREGDRRPVVLSVSLSPAFGGAERSQLDLLTALPAAGWRAVLTCPEGPYADEARRLGVDTLTLPWRHVRNVSDRSSGRKRYRLGAVAAALTATLVNAGRLWTVARRVRADVVHSNSLPSHLFVALGGRLARTPVVWHLREIVSPGRGRRVLSRVSRLVATPVAISRAVAASLDNPRTVVVTDPVTPPQSWPAPAFTVPRPAVGYLGRLDPQKGVEDVLALAGALPSVSVAVVGSPMFAPEGYERRLRGLARDTAADRVHFVGSTSTPWEALAAVDVLVVPSRLEPWGRVAAEAQLAGVPVVVAAAGGLVEIVTDEVDGLHYAPGDVDALRRQVERLLTDAALRERLVSAGRRRLAAYSRGTHAHAVAAVFHAAVSGTTPARRRAATPYAGTPVPPADKPFEEESPS